MGLVQLSPPRTGHPGAVAALHRSRGQPLAPPLQLSRTSTPAIAQVRAGAGLPGPPCSRGAGREFLPPAAAHSAALRTADSKAEARGKTELLASWALSTRVSPLICSGAGRRRRRETRDNPGGPGRAAPHTDGSGPTHPVGTTRARLQARTRALCRIRGQDPRKQDVLNAKREPFLCPWAARNPATSGLLRALAGRGQPGPRALGGAPGVGNEPASPRMAAPPWAASPGGPHGSSPPKFVVPWKKRLSLTKHKGETPRPSPEKLRIGGRGRPEAREHGGRAGLRLEKVAGLSQTSAAAVAAGPTAATRMLAEKFCSQVGRREIVTQLKAGLG
ncbi:collagen alpha-1(II) chain-like [Tupaia chinensis]|uniref:collagen alpha-1(II) chain-like n=1 Tax=Tupaia chinensis TaxID=246437 RepID=UPI000FFB1A86|nr:collagen alpha-1(II) chain-like [Tupaia chinensis]